MTKKQKINYASQLAIHPLIAEHPLYKSILEGEMKNYSFVENDFSSPLTMIPTYYKYIPMPHCIVIEDYITLFFPHIHNGSNYQFNYKKFPMLESYRQAFESDNFRGVVCHMKQTLESISTIFGDNEKINKKLFYLPLAYDSPIKSIKPTDDTRIVLTFTNSFGGQSNNFPLRGGLECLMAYKELYESGYTNIYLNLTGEVKLEPELLKWFHECDNVKIFQPNTVRHDRKMLTDESIHDILKETDIFLDGILKERYSLFLEQPNQILLRSIKQRIVALIEDTKNMDRIKERNLLDSKEKFSKSKRDRILEDMISKMLEN